MNKFTLEELYSFQIHATNAQFKEIFGDYEVWQKFLDLHRNVVTLSQWLVLRDQQTLERLITTVLKRL